MNRVKYIDGKYMSWEETMEDFHENLKVKKAEEAYKEYLINLKNGFPDKQKLSKVPSSLPDQTQPDQISMPIDSQSSFQYSDQYQQLQPQFSVSYDQHSFDQPIFNKHSFDQHIFDKHSYDQHEFDQHQHSFDQSNFNPASNFQTNFNSEPSFNLDTNFNQFNFNSPSFNHFSSSQSYNFNNFNNQFNPNSFSSFNQFNFNDSFSTNASLFTPKASFGQLSFNGSITKLPIQFNRLENDIIFEEPVNSNLNLNLNTNLSYF